MKIKVFPTKEQALLNTIDKLNADRDYLKKLPIDLETKLPKFKLKIGDTVYTDKKEAAKAFEAVALTITKADKPVEVGEFQGYPLSLTVNSSAFDGGITATIKGNYTHTAKLSESFSHNVRKLEAMLYNIDKKIGDVNTDLGKLRADYAEAERIVNEPFPQEQELADKESRLKSLTTELNLAAIEAKKNAKPKEKTCFFERAQLKKEAIKRRNQPSKKEKKHEKTSPAME